MIVFFFGKVLRVRLLVIIYLVIIRRIEWCVINDIEIFMIVFNFFMIKKVYIKELRKVGSKREK